MSYIPQNLAVKYGGTGDSNLTTNGIMIGKGQGSVKALAQASNGQILIGSTGTEPVLNTLTAGSSNITITNGAGTITIDSAGAIGAINGTANQISASTVAGTTTLALTNGISIGSYQATSPPTGGIIAPGQVSLGSSSPITGSLLSLVPGTSPIACEANNVCTGVDGLSNQNSFICLITHTPSSNVTNTGDFNSFGIFKLQAGITATSGSSFRASPTFGGNVGTITTMYGFWFDGGGTGAGTITNSYGGFFNTPAFGTTKVALYSDDLTVGSSKQFVIAPAGNSTVLSSSNSGAIVESVTNNTSNTVSSAARVNIHNGGGSGGDVYSLYQVDGNPTNTWETGVQNSTGSYQIYAGSTVATPNLTGSNYLTINTNGVLTFPSQIYFWAYLSSNVTNATGNAAIWQLGTTTALTILHEQGTAMNTNGTFTAPVAGIYMFAYAIAITNIGSAGTTGWVALLPSGPNTYIYGTQTDPVALRAGTTASTISMVGSAIFQLAANETVTANVSVLGQAANSVTVQGGEGITYFMGCKIA